MNLAALEIAMCCEGDKCLHPEACYRADRARSVPVRLDKAARAVQTLCAQWQTQQQRNAVPINSGSAFW